MTPAERRRKAKDELSRLGGDAVRCIHPYVVGEFIGKGAEGFVALTKVPDTGDECVIKIAEVLEDTSLLSARRAYRIIDAYYKAADCGVGPRVIYHGVFDIKERSTCAYFVVTERLTRSLDASYPFKAKDAVRALRLYARLARSGGYYHQDLKTTNIMFDAQGKMYLIDMGQAQPVDGHPEEDEKDVLNGAIDQLCQTMFATPSRATELGVSTSWYDEEDEELKGQIMQDVVDALDDELERLCPSSD
jgi:tRNA A-37 threonylcarbamoyl transferase component Bud32